MRNFTQCTLAVAAAGAALGTASSLWAVGSCMVVFTAVTFHCALLLDRTCFARMRAKEGWSASVFHAGNLLLHVAPLTLVVLAPPRSLSPWHVGGASLAYAMWAGVRSGGTFCLDHVYVPMRPRAWVVIPCMGVMGEACLLMACNYRPT